ncbi:MAG: PilZ domain-containing protein [Acidimicrobiia bacterium]|nr:PilZ domain-containing protein [Acidimicrobiia bacterium]
MRGGERRQHPRDPSAGARGVVAIRVRPGIQATLIDLSRSGAALETERRLVPGRFVHVQLAGPTSVVTVRAKVLRNAVSRLSAGLIVYRCAVQFDRALGLDGEG